MPNVINEIFHIENGVLYTYRGKGRKLTIPKDVVKIKENVFMHSNVEKVYIPSSVSIIHKRAFANSKIEEIIMEDGIKILEEEAFAYIATLKKVTLSATILPATSAISVFRDSKEIEKITVSKLNAKILYFLDSKAFPNLKEIEILDNSYAYANQLCLKFSSKNVNIIIGGKQLENKDEILSYKYKLKKLFKTLPPYFEELLGELLDKFIKEEVNNNKDSLLKSKLQSIITSFIKFKEIVPLMEEIQSCYECMDNEYLVLPAVKNTANSYFQYLQYMALKFNNINLSKQMMNLIRNTGIKICSYLFDNNNLLEETLLESSKAIFEKDVEILYLEISTLYNQTRLGVYVDLLDSLRGETNKENVFSIFHAYIQRYIKSHVNETSESNAKSFGNVEKVYNKFTMYEKFITDEIEKILRGEITRYKDCQALENDLIKDFVHRDKFFKKFFESYLIFEGMESYAMLINTIRLYKKQKNYFGYRNVIDQELSNVLESTRLLITGLDEKIGKKYLDELDQEVDKVDGMLQHLVKITPKNLDYLSDDKNLYDMQMNSDEIKQDFVNKINGILNSLEIVIDKPYEEALLLKSIDTSLALLKDEELEADTDIEKKTKNIKAIVNKLPDGKIKRHLNKLLKAVLCKVKDNISGKKEDDVLKDLNNVQELAKSYLEEWNHINELESLIMSTN